MIDVRIVCSRDALTFAETLMRLLTAEGHHVRLCFGRASMQELQAAKSERDAVLLVWSFEAPTQHYMLEWERGIPHTRIVEIARAPGAPQSEKRPAPIDFSSWRGERGGRAWNSLSERLRNVERALEPSRPVPARAAIAMGLVSAAAVTGALFVRANDTTAPGPVIGSDFAASDESREAALGGPLTYEEPASLESTDIEFNARLYRVARMPEFNAQPLTDLSTGAPPQLRERTLLERLATLNPLQAEDN